jgi:DNA-binding MarR family transcriptional regulator
MHEKMKEMERIEISGAVQRELESNSKIKVLLHVQDKGEISAYQIAKDFGWQPSKAHAIVKQLEKSHSVRVRPDVVNGRSVKLIRLAGD